MCGICGEISKTRELKNLGERIRDLMIRLQHRGQEAAGALVSDGYNVTPEKNFGEVIEVLSLAWALLQEGSHGIGHLRYSTAGKSLVRALAKLTLGLDALSKKRALKSIPSAKNIQPFYTESVRFGRIGLVHNGNLTNADKLKKQLQKKGVFFDADSDTEVILKLICYYAQKRKNSIPRAIRKAMGRMKGAYSCILMTREGLWAFRDSLGFRPLKIAETKDSFIFTSELLACHGRETFKPKKHKANVLAGEIVEVKVGTGKLTSYPPRKKRAKRSFCIFEDIYLQGFGPPKIADCRFGFGTSLFNYHPFPGIVVPIMNSGEGAALGYHYAQNLKFPGRAFYYPALYKDPLTGRTFLAPDQKTRIAKNKRKYFPLFQSLAPMINQLAKTEKQIWLIFIDDSLVRANTSRTLIKIIRRELKVFYPELYRRFKIAWLLSSPPIVNPCYFGIDTYDKKKLIAANKTMAQIKRSIGCSHLGYIPLEDILNVAAKVHHLKTCDFCTGCFQGGKYPIKINPKQDKMSVAKA